jgi:hypothetical protein
MLRALHFCVLALVLARAQDPAEPKPETFFAGNVIELTPEKITVSRVVLGKKEKRVFRITPDTKCDGKLKTKAWVTVRYIASEDGEKAELIIIRTQKK